MKRAVIYARYSSSNQTEQSIEGQVRVCSEYAKAKGLTIVGEYIDRAISGRTDNRPDFQRLMQDSGKHMFEAVIVYRTDRFARNKYDSAIYKRHLRKCNVELHYAAEHIPEGPEGIILESLMEGLAEYYSAELSQKIRRGIRESALKGKATGGNIALGYKIGPDKSFIVDEKEAEAVRMIFDMFVRQKPNSEICRYLNDLGIKTSRGNPFTKSSIPRIIQNEKYIGVYKCGDIRIEDAVPAIVSKEVFAMAQKENARRRTSKQAALPRAEYLLSGKLFCGHCKKKMTGVSGTGRRGGKFYYYYCPTARSKKGCDKKHVSKDWLEDLVVAETLDHILRPDALKYIANACYEIQLKDKTGDEEVEFFRRRIAENKRALDNTLKAIESGVETMTLPVRLKELEMERLQLHDELKAAEARKVVLTPEHIEFMLMQYAEKGEDEQAYKKEIIECFVSEVYLYDDKLLIYYNINKNHPELAKSDLALLESDGFDQRDDASRLREVPGVRYENIVMFDDVNSSGMKGNLPDDMADMYIGLLENCQEQYRRIACLLLECTGLTLFHCTAGKDRTGVLAMLLLQLAGVDKETITTDYAATEQYLPPQKNCQELAARGIQIPLHVLQAQPCTMEKTLEYLLATWGGAAQYFAACGLSPKEVEKLKQRLL